MRAPVVADEASIVGPRAPEVPGSPVKMGLGFLLEAALVLASAIIFYVISLQAFNSSTSPLGKIAVLPRMASVAPPIRTVFAGTFAICCVLFELVIFEVTGLMVEDGRRFFWRLCFWLVLSLLTFVIPGFEIASVIQSLSLGTVLTIVATLVTWIGFFIAFWSLSGHAGMIAPDETVSILELLVSRVGLIGVSLIALVSGFGAISAPHHYFLANFKKIPDNDFRELEKRLAQVNDEIASARNRLLEAKDQANSDHNKGFFGKMLATVTETFTGSEVDRIAEETAALDQVYNELAAEVDNMSFRKQNFEYYTTWQGKFEKLLGQAMSLYCIFRIISASVSLFSGGSYGGDPVSKAIALIVHIVNYDFDTQFWAQQISFILAGCIIMATVRNFLNLLFKILRKLSISDISNIGILVVAQIMGLYFVASVLLLKLTLPPEYRPVLAGLLKAIRLDFISRWFDCVFLIGAIGGLLITRLSTSMNEF